MHGQVSVLLTTDAAIRKLNRQFRGKNKATDVLSFPALDPSQVSNSRPGAPESRLAGDLAISVDTAREQAEAFGHPLGIELKVLMLHGLLHLAGYDHEIDDGEMAKWERALRAKLGLPLGLIERTGFPTLAKTKTRSRSFDSASLRSGGARGLVLPHPSRKTPPRRTASIHPSEYKSLTVGPGMGHPASQRVGESAGRRKP